MILAVDIVLAGMKGSCAAYCGAHDEIGAVKLSFLTTLSACRSHLAFAYWDGVHSGPVHFKYAVYDMPARWQIVAPSLRALADFSACFGRRQSVRVPRLT